MEVPFISKKVSKEVKATKSTPFEEFIKVLF